MRLLAELAQVADLHERVHVEKEVDEGHARDAHIVDFAERPDAGLSAEGNVAVESDLEIVDHVSQIEGQAIRQLERNAVLRDIVEGTLDGEVIGAHDHGAVQRRKVLCPVALRTKEDFASLRSIQILIGLGHVIRLNSARIVPERHEVDVRAAPESFVIF